MLGIGLVFIVCWGGYWFARRFTNPAAGLDGHLGSLAAAPGLGFGLLSLGYFFVVHFGLPKSFVGALFVALLLGPWVSKRWLRRDPPPEGTPLERSSGNGDSDGDRDGEGFFRATTPLSLRVIFAGVALLVAASLFTNGWVRTKAQPLGGFDAIAIWNVHALFLHRVDGGHAEIYRQIERGHPEYPLLVPGAVAACFDLLDHESRSVPFAMAFSITAGMVLFVYVGVRRLGSGTLAFPAALAVAAWPVLPKHAFSLTADIWVAYYALAAAVGLCGLLPGRPSDRPALFHPVVPGLCLGLLAWTKNEGSVLALLLGGLFFAFSLWGGRGDGAAGRNRADGKQAGWKRAVYGSAAVAAATVPAGIALVLFRLHWVSSKEAGAFLADFGAKVSDLDRWWIIASGLGGQLIPLRTDDPWGLFWILAAGGAILALRRPWGARRTFLLCAFLAATGIYMSFYLISPYDLTWHVARSIERLLMQLTPLFAVWLFSSLDLPRETDRPLP